MKFYFATFLPVISGFLQQTLATHSKSVCLSEKEATSISDRWLHIWWTGAITKRSQLESIVTENVASYDEAFGGPTLSLDELFAIFTGPSGPQKVTNVTQKRMFFIHSCDGIAVRWQYLGVTTGYNSTTPAGTAVEFKGTDLLHVDLKSRLIDNATSTADWILLAQQLGDDCST